MQTSTMRGAIILALAAIGCAATACPANSAADASVRAAIAQGLIASEGSRLTLDQVHSFSAHLGDTWAVAYDPAVPAGCAPGGLSTATPGGVPAKPCFAYVLHRRKSTWELSSKGYPGQLALDNGVPVGLGDKGKLEYLAP